MVKRIVWLICILVLCFATVSLANSNTFTHNNTIELEGASGGEFWNARNVRSPDPDNYREIDEESLPNGLIGGEFYNARNMKSPQPDKNTEFKSKLDSGVYKGEDVIDPNKPILSVFIYLDPAGVADPIKSTQVVYDAVKTNLDITKKVNVLPIETTNKILRGYVRENNTVNTARKSDEGFVPKRNDLMALAAASKSDYVLYMNIRMTNQELKFNFWTGVNAHRTVLTDVLLIGREQTEYLVDEAFSDVDSSTVSFDRAYRVTLKKLLEKIDLSQVEFKLIPPNNK